MVSLGENSILRNIFTDLLVQLKQVDRRDIDYAFALWIYPKLRSDVSLSLPLDFAVTNYSHIAHLAYLIEVDASRFIAYEDVLKDGLMRTAGRAATIMGVGPASFCNDAVALLGLALGAKRVGGETLAAIDSWMQSFIDLSTSNLPAWKKIFMYTALNIIRPNATTMLAEPSSSVSDVQLALQSRGLTYFPKINLDTAYHAACSDSIQQQAEIPLIAIRLQVIDYLTNHLPAISLSQPTVEQVIVVLENLPHAFRRWVWEEKPKTTTGTAQKWDVQNEYHVQSLLSFVLTPLFPDIETEFYLENTGHLNPRADIGLPSLNLIIEVKFLRPKVSFQKMVEEIAADATLYFKKDGVFKDKYSKLLVFLWDNSNRTEEHGTFKNGIRSFQNIVDAVVISRPGYMT